MSRVRGAVAAGAIVACLGGPPVFAAEPVGQATLIKTQVTGEDGPLVVKAPVHRDERIRTSPSGLGQFLFRDGTKLAVGAGSSVTIDKFVYDDEDTVKRLSIKAAKGTFRWISGNSASSAYQIVTPAGTIGVRGTAFDFYVAPNGVTAMVLLNGSAQFCGAGGCRQLRQQCDCVIATPRRGVSDVAPVDRATLRELGNNRALPFLSGNQQLSGALGNIRTTCGLQAARIERRDPITPRAPEVAPPPPPQQPPEAPKPPKPHHHHHPHHHWGHPWGHHPGGWHPGGFGNGNPPGWQGPRGGWQRNNR